MAVIPELMPVLSRGKHKNPSKGACFLEYTSVLAGEPFSDSPGCVDRGLAAVLRHANDLLGPAAPARPGRFPRLGGAVGRVAPPPTAADAGAPAPGMTADQVDDAVGTY